MTKDPVERGMVIPDQHFPMHDRAAFKCVLRAIDIVKPSRFINLGDVSEWQSTNAWSKSHPGKQNLPLELMVPKISEEIGETNFYLDMIDRELDAVGCGERYVTQGNHDIWVDNFYDANPIPEFEHFRFRECLKWKERGYQYHPAGEFLRIGKLYFYHGHHYGGIYHARSHLLKLGCNVMYAHWHDIQQHAVTHVDGAKQAWSIGCLKDMRREMGNEWLGGRRTNWGHAFAIVDWWDRGHFTVHVVNIIGGKCSLWGHVINGNR